MRMPPQHSTNTRVETDNSLEHRTSKYMQDYREFNQNNKPPDVPDWLRGQNTNPKRAADEQMKKMSPSDMVNKTSTRKPTQVFNDSEAFPSNEIEDFGGNSNFSYFNDTPEITSAFDDAFYNTGIDPASMNDVMLDSIDERLKKAESARNAMKAPDKKVENIEELFKNDSEFKKHVNMSNKNFHKSSYDNDQNEQNINKMINQTNQNQQLMAQQNRMHPSIEQSANMYNQQPQYQQSQYQQQIQYHQKQNNEMQQVINKYQEQFIGMRDKMGKYEEYLKTLMQKYNELKEDRDLLKERFKNVGSNGAIDAIDEKKRELLKISNDIQEKISRLEQLQNQSQN